MILLFGCSLVQYDGRDCSFWLRALVFHFCAQSSFIFTGAFPDPLSGDITTYRSCAKSHKSVQCQLQEQDRYLLRAMNSTNTNQTPGDQPDISFRTSNRHTWSSLKGGSCGVVLSEVSRYVQSYQYGGTVITSPVRSCEGEYGAEKKHCNEYNVATRTNEAILISNLLKQVVHAHQQRRCSKTHKLSSLCIPSTNFTA